MPKRRPFGFIHDIRLKYFKFHGLKMPWFYPEPGYSADYVKRNGYDFDGQIFFKRGKL